MISHIITALGGCGNEPVNPTDDESFRHCIFRRGVYVQTRAVADGAVICYRYGNGDAAWNPYKIRWCTPGNCDHNQAAGIRKKIITPFRMAVICGTLICIAGFAYSAGLNGLDRINMWQMLLISSLEGIVAFCMVFVFNYAIRIFLFHKNENALANEEQISLGITLALCVYAFRTQLMQTYSVLQTIILFVVLYIGYCYGAGGGAIAGDVIGSVMAYQQSDVSLPGYMAMLRDFGRSL